jgi:dihydropteroate synthase
MSVLAGPAHQSPVHIMGILNVTPDSFAESSALVDAHGQIQLEESVARAQEMVAAGATIIDVGGESTRPGAQRIQIDEELARVLPIVRTLVDEGMVVSVDTTRAAVAEQALALGASLINDVSGGTADEQMLSLIAQSASPYVLMHGRGSSAQMYARALYDDVVQEVCVELAVRVDAAVAAGVSPEQIIIDPGLGFAKLPEHNWALLAGMKTLVSLGLPVLIGASRKRFLGELLANPDGAPRAEPLRDVATAAISFAAAEAGAWGLRVHDVSSTADAVAVASALRSRRRMDKAQAASTPLVGGASLSAHDTISVTGIVSFGYHGVFDFERRDGQTFSADVRVALSTNSRAASTDDIADAPNYAELGERVKAHLNGEPVNLIETLAENIAQDVLCRFDCAGVEVTVHKPQAPLAHPFSDVACSITRWRQR